MARWVYWVSLIFILTVVAWPLYGLLTDPQADIRDLFRLGIDLEGGTSLIYELKAPEGGTQTDARAAKQVITTRIDPNGTRGYTVRAIGERRLEIVLPGRATRVRITEEAVTRENLAAAQKAATDRQNTLADFAIKDNFDAFLDGTRFVVRLKPALYLDDIQNRITQTLRERLPVPRPPVAIIGLTPEKEQWESVLILVGRKLADEKNKNVWEEMITTALATQRDVTRVKRLVRQAGFLEFRIVADRVKDRDKVDFDRLIRLKKEGRPPDTTQYRWYPLKKGYEWYKQNLLDEWNFVYVPDLEAQSVDVLVDVADGQDVTGRDMAHAGASSQDGAPIVTFAMRQEAAARFAKLTNPDVRKRHLAIILDGIVQSAPTLQATLSSGGIIEGYRNNVRERDEVVTILNSGQLAASLGDPVTERTVGPELGADNIQKGFQASVIGVALVVLFMIAYYRVAGLVANVALLLNLVMTICIMYAIRQTWTLPGIAGLILSLAMAVDANVLIYERLREEKGKEGSLAFALKKAYQRAFTTILDSNLTTVIPAFVLLMPGLATEEVKGFAVVMIIGIGVSMFTAVVVTRMMFETGMKTGLIKRIEMFQLFKRPNLDWMKFARTALVISVGIAALGAIVFLSRGSEKYDIEFTGGTQVELALKVPKGQKEVSIEVVRERAEKALGGAAAVQSLVYANAPDEGKIAHFLISVPATGVKVTGEGPVKDALLKGFEDMMPAESIVKAAATGSEITDAVIRQYLAASRPVPPADAEAPKSEFIPPEQRQFLGMVRVQATVQPPMSVAEVQRRVEALLRDRYSDLVGIPVRVQGVERGEAAGEFKSFDVWVRQPFAGVRIDIPNATLWADVVRSSIGSTQEFASTTSFEPTMAGEAWDKAVMAILLSLAAMVVYIWIRFANFASGLAAVIALIHDVLITLGAITVSAYVSDTFFGTTLLLTDFKVNLPLVGAFLTLVGYSVNDTIVVFDRIRENRGKYGDMSVAIVNASINQTMSRTVLTSTTVFLAVVALYFFGGKTSSIHGLSFVMLFGTIVGTYSSICIASPILVLREYLYRVYSWAFPIIGVGLLAYFCAVWQTPDAFFGSVGGIVWAVLQLAWVGLGWSVLSNHAYGRPWSLAQSSPGAVRALAYLSILAPLGAVILFAVAVLAAKGSGAPAWAGPASFGLLASCPITYALWSIVRSMAGKKD